MKTCKLFYCCICLLCTATMLFGCSSHTFPTETIEVTAPVNNTVPTVLTEPKTIEQGIKESIPIAETELEETGGFDGSASDPIIDQITPGTPEAVQLKFHQILSGKDCFKVPWLDKEVTVEAYCASCDPSGAVSAAKYGLADLDHDDVSELILCLTENEISDYGMLVIRYEDNCATGYEFTYRQMIDIKKDGTFGYSGGIVDTGFARLRFADGNWEYEKIGNVEETGEMVSFFYNGKAVSEDIYWQFASEQNAKEGIEWIDCP